MAGIKRHKLEPTIPAASLSDIIFLLLIFFLVTTTMAVEKGLPMALPGKQSKTVKLKQESVYNIKITAAGEITTKDAGVMSSKALREHIEGKLAVNDKLVIVIETHPDAAYGIMIDVLDELRLAKATRISLRTTQPGA